MNKKDFCGTTHLRTHKITKEDYRLFLKTYINDGGNIVRLTEDNISKYIDTDIHYYSPVTCISEHICDICYGDTTFDIREIFQRRKPIPFYYLNDKR